MSTSEERRYIGLVLMPEIKKAFELWAKEYKQPRDLGKRGEFASLYRKVRKLKTLIWDDHRTHGDWREDERTIIMEVIAHGFLMLMDHDQEQGDFARRYKAMVDEEDEDEDEEDFTSQGKQANRISLRERRAAARRQPVGRQLVTEEAREGLSGTGG